MRVLVVEDNPVNQKLLDLMLRQFGYEAVFAENGEQGVARFQQESFDLILMDIQMPVMDGFAATERIRGIEKEQGLSRVPIIAVTAHVLDGYREKCLEAGMDNYLPKPFRLQELRDIIEETLDQVRHPS